MDLNGKNVLITQFRLHDYAGSEIVTLELTEYFMSQGANVSIVTNSHGEPISREFREMSGLNIFKHGSKELSDYLNVTNIDIAWIHHQLIPIELIKNPGKTKFIFHHMSPYAPLEFPIFWRIEMALADNILCNSQETLDKLIRDGIFSKYDKRLGIFGNPSPDNFKDVFKNRVGIKPKRFLIVSNHVPAELMDAKANLEKIGVEVSIFGAGGDKYNRVNPQDIDKFDAVISIGKTVQYSIMAGIPVYCYDRFGGPGYLNYENYEKAKKLNFSGRGFSDKTADVIATELVSNYKEAAKFVFDIESERNNFSLPTSIERVLSYILSKVRNRTTINKKDTVSYTHGIELLGSLIPNSVHNVDKSQKLIKSLRETVSKRDKRIHNLETMLKNITKSVEYKIVHKVTVMANFIKHLFQRTILGYVPDNSHTHNDSQNEVSASLLEKYYGFRQKLSGIKVALVSRGAPENPTSSFFIRLISPLTYGRNAKRVNVSIYNTRELSLIPKDTDICIVQRTAFDDFSSAEHFIDKMNQNGTKLIVDTDDSFSSIDHTHPEYFIQKVWVSAFKTLVAHADEVWVSTNALKKDIEHNNVKVICNSQDNRVWCIGHHKILNKKQIKMVYMGTMTHESDLNLVISAIEKINQKYNNIISLTVIGVAHNLPKKKWIKVLQPPVEKRSYPVFVEWLCNQDEKFDLGIAPLVDSKFNKAKSDIKVLDYLAMGVLPIVSDLTPYINSELDPFVLRVGYEKGAWYHLLEDVVKNRKKYSQIKSESERFVSIYLNKVRSTKKVSRQILKNIRRIKRSNNKKVKS